MLSSISLLALLPLGLAAPSGPRSSASPSPAPACASGVRIISAPGSSSSSSSGILSRANTSILSKIARSTSSLSSSSSSSSIASTSFSSSSSSSSSPEEDYWASIASGVEAMTAEIEAYFEACPDAQMVLLGEGPGANVLADVLGGEEIRGRPTGERPSLDLKVWRNVAAVVAWNDPSYSAAKTHDQGSCVDNGPFAREETSHLNDWARKMWQWCEPAEEVPGLKRTDPVTEAVRFVVEKVEKAEKVEKVEKVGGVKDDETRSSRPSPVELKS